MTEQAIYPITRQGVRNLDNSVPVGPPKGARSERERDRTLRGGETQVKVGPPDQVESTRRQNVGPRERAASMLIGAVTVGYGLGRRDLAGILIAALATGLICRGVVGHCAVYDAAGINTAR